MSARLNVQDYIDDYNPPPRPLVITDCLKIFENFFAKDDLLLHQDITLHDPITFKRLSNPCRGIYCQHLQCFEYESYRELNRKKSPCEFVCPICKETANPTKIYIDSIWINLLRHFPQADTIKVNANGICESRYNPKSSIGVILIDDDNDSDTSIGQYQSHTFPSSSGATTAKIELNKPISIMQFSFYPTSISKSLAANNQVMTIDELFDCNIDDVLYFINNCKVEELQIIPSIGEYYAERITKSRPFISCTFAALNHDLVLKLNRLRFPAAQSMIENLERVVKVRLQQLKLRYQDIHKNRFQASSTFGELWNKKTERKRLKRMREKGLSDEDELFSPIKTEKVPIQSKTESSSLSSLSIRGKEDYSEDTSRKRKFQPQHSSGAVDVEEDYDKTFENTSAEATPIKKPKKSKKDKKDRKEREKRDNELLVEENLLQSNNNPTSFLTSTRASSFPLVSEVPSSSVLGKKLYFQISDDFTDNTRISKSTLSTPESSHPSFIATTATPTHEDNITSSLRTSTVNNTCTNNQSFDDRHVYLVPSLLLEDDDIFGLGFISTVTRPLEDVNPPIASITANKEETNVIDLSKPADRPQAPGNNRHIRFSDEDSDTTTQTTSSAPYDFEVRDKPQNKPYDRTAVSSTTSSTKNWFHPVLPVPQISTSTSSSAYMTGPKKHMQLLPVFNAKLSSTSLSSLTVKESTLLSVPSDSVPPPFPTIGMDRISEEVNNIFPFPASPMGGHPPTPTPQGNLNHPSSRFQDQRSDRKSDRESRKRSHRSHSNGGSNSNSNGNGSEDPSSSIVQLMISEFATG